MSEWLRWRPEIAKACDGSYYTIESIERGIVEGNAQILTMPDCCFIVEVVDYEQERACQITWAAGDLPAILGALPRVHAWAKERGCTEMLVEGRAGWARALRDIGYRPWSVTVRKAL